MSIYCVYQGGPFDHCTNVTGPVAQSSAEREYNSACMIGMDLSHFRMLNNKMMDQYLYMVTHWTPLIILDIKSDVCMSDNGKYTKHTRHIYRRMKFVRTGEECNMHKKRWCEGGMKLSDIGTKNVSQDELNTIVGYDMVRLDN